MRHPVRPALIFALLALGLRAQVAPPTADAPAAHPAAPSPAVTATAPAAPAAPKRTRAISGDVAALLASTLPKYTPPPPAPPQPTAADLAKKLADEEADAADLRDTDKPKNAIVRLPKYVVREQRPAVLTERDINTKKGLREIAMRRYISDADRALNRFSLPLFAGWSPGSGDGSSTEQRALSMYAEDERLRNMADLADNANMIMKSDRAAGASAKDAVQKTYMRSTEFGYNGMAPK